VLGHIAWHELCLLKAGTIIDATKKPWPLARAGRRGKGLLI
jgi:hypothetical protein